MSIASRLKDARHWLHRARKRLWGTRKTLDQLDAELKRANTPEERQKVKERIAKNLDEERRRENVKDKLAKKVEHLEKEKDREPSPTSGVATFDGKQVPAWMVPWLEKSRKAGWGGYVISGWHSPAYSTSLCIAMCGAPTCPGRCAGAGSNHSGSTYPAGAIDVDVAHASQFESIQFKIGSPLRNYLAYDPNHFSVSGR